MHFKLCCAGERQTLTRGFGPRFQKRSKYAVGQRDRAMSSHNNTMKRITHLCLMLLALGMTSSVTAAADSKQAKPKPTGIFSDMQCNDEGGDLLGTEVFITYAHDGYFVVYQSSEGEPITPVVVPATISGTSITFVVPKTADPRGSFSGTIGAKELTGSFSGSKEIVHLKRKASYWQ